MQQSNPKMLRACYKDAVRNPLVANAGLIHKRGECGPVLCAFSVGGAAASCQLPIIGRQRRRTAGTRRVVARPTGRKRTGSTRTRSEEHTSELQSLMRISYAVFCLKNETQGTTHRQCHYKASLIEKKNR